MKKKSSTTILVILCIVAAIFLFKGKGFMGAVGGTSTVSRSFSYAYAYPGDTLTVTLAISPTNVVNSVLINDAAPTGWTITGLTTNVINFGKLSQTGITAYTETYSIIIPSTATASTYTFTGKYTVDGGADQAISGPSIQVKACAHTTDNTCNGVDEDCDRLADEHWVATTCGTGACASTNTCVNGVQSTCVPKVGVNAADADCSGKVDWTEINAHITKWMAGTVTWTDINSAVALWVTG